MSEYIRTPQQPLGSGYGATTTAAEIMQGVNLSGKTAIVTGGYAGIGLGTVRALTDAGATVIVPARTPEKARQNLAGIPNVEQGYMDLMDPESIDAFAKGFLASGRSLDLLINNAGIMAPPLERDARGYESQFSANHLGHFQLTARLWPALLASGAARVVELSSRGHQYGPVDFDDPNFERRPYDRWGGYGQSKTANILFAVALDRLGAAHGIRAFAVHPGGIITDLARHMTVEEMAPYGITPEILASGTIPDRLLVSHGGDLKTVEQGTATTLWAATSPQLAGKGGVYAEDGDLAAVRTPETTDRYGVAPYAIDPENAERLWTLSEDLTGVKFAGS